MKTLWVGIRRDAVLCGSELGHETVLRIDNGAHLDLGESVVEAIRSGGEIIGIGEVIVVSTGEFLTVNRPQLLRIATAMKRGLGHRGIGGPLNINVEDIPEAR